MTDRELLELAAKAAGVEIVGIEEFVFWDFTYDPAILREWNPLTDDGDALRLAVRLNLEVGIWNQDYCHGDPKVLVCDNTTCEEKITNEPITDDPYAATRRAIVRAAAEIGKEMK